MHCVFYTEIFSSSIQSIVFLMEEQKSSKKSKGCNLLCRLVTPCSVESCNSVKIPGIPNFVCFHSFPKDSNRCSEWLKKVGSADLKTKKMRLLHTNYYICSLHFKEDDYVKRKTLKDSAIPSINLPISNFITEGTKLLYC